MTEIKEIAPEIRLIVPTQDKSAWESPNLYLVGTDPVVLIDAGYNRESNYGPVIDTLGDAKLELILLTHAHYDHAEGSWTLQEKTGAKLACHALEEPGMERRFGFNEKPARA